MRTISNISRRMAARTFLTGLVLFGTLLPSAWASSPPPDLVNYQGVLRNADGTPFDGTVDMVLRFFTAEIAGDELLVDSHEQAGSGGVAVSDSLFNVALGSGTLVDGSGPGVFDSLADVFSDNTEVWLQVEINGEELTPRTRIVAAAYALSAENARSLEGKAAAEFLDTSAGAQTKTGSLTVGGLTVASPLNITGGSQQRLNFSNGQSLRAFDDGVVRLGAGPTLDDGIMSVALGGPIELDPANGEVLFSSLAGQTSMDPDGDWSFPGDISLGQSVFFGGSVASLQYAGGIFALSDTLQVGNDLEVRGNQITLGDQLIVEEQLDLNFIAEGYQWFMIDAVDSSPILDFRVYHDGTFDNASLLAEIQEDGDLRIRGTLFQNVSFDLAEAFFADETLEPGDVVSVAEGSGNSVRRAHESDGGRVIGVVSGDPGMVLGGTLMDEQSLEKWGPEIRARYHAEKKSIHAELLAAHPELAAGDDAPGRSERLANELESLGLETFAERYLAHVALSGRVPVKVDTSLGAIEPGDALAASPTPGVAMKATSAGPTIGTALASAGPGATEVLAFINRGYWAPESSGVAEATLSAAPQAEIVEVAARAPNPETGTQALASNMQVVLDSKADDESRFSIFRDGEESLDNELLRVDEQGNLLLRGALRPDAMDLAEFFAVSESVEAGDLLVVDRSAPGLYRKASEAYDPAVVGIVSSKPGVVLGSGLERVLASDASLRDKLAEARALQDGAREASLWRQLEQRFREQHAPVALSGTVPCKVDAGYGAIRPGDLLTTSPTPGHAQRADEALPGTIVGKALESLESGTGTIRVLIMMR